MKKGDLFPLSSPYSVIGYSKYGTNARIQYTGEKRCPKKGEWYLSGAIIEGYRTPNDLSFPYYIGKLVKVKIVEVMTVEEEV